MDSRKLEIIDKATGIFLKYGIKSVTMDDMARELGMSKKTLYTYFSDKNDMVTQIISAKTEFDRSQCVLVKTEAENAIDEMFRVNSYVSVMMKGIHASVFYDLKRFHPEAMALLHDHKWGFVRRMILENIVRGKAEGLYRAELPDEIIARIYVGATDMISDGEAFADLDKTSDQIFNEIMHFQLFAMVNEKGLEYLKLRMEN
ncbi:MAG: TetR/AcrR family transcriptional regulator [Crocinitomicaceae bacterium]|jgi:AcrR family transcriptional regulator|nr:TetR/AcrR family transcriptional regulator [Crocinitomicaceae bacterium]